MSPLAKLCPRGTEVQTLLFPRTEFGSHTAVRSWLQKYGEDGGRYIDDAPNFYHVRLRPVTHFAARSLRTKPLGKHGVMAVVGCPRRAS